MTKGVPEKGKGISFNSKGRCAMLLRQMQYFIKVKETNSFTEAAEQLFVSQPAVSQQIRSLEQELGVELIHRENHY